MTNSAQVSISSFWGPRMESAGALAERWKFVIRRLQALDPAFAIWFVEQDDDVFRVSLEDAEQRILKGRCDHELLGYSYWVRTQADPAPGARNFALWMNAGSMASNMALLMTDYGIVPDPTLVTYRIFRAAILAIAEGFDVERAWAYPSALMDFWKPQHNPNPSFPIAWISYVAKRASHLVNPPPTAIIEHRPDGGLLMSATDETFDVANPAHMAVARDIEAATAPLHCHPWLPEDPAR